MSDRVREHNKQMRFAVDEDTWPPNQPQEFTPLLLVHHDCKQTSEQVTAMQLAESIQYRRHQYPQDSHQLGEALNNSKTTKQLVDILAPLQDNNEAHFILVEGLPGIGKSLLLQEIAYGWAKGKLLKHFKIVLLVQLCSPAVQQVSLVADLFQLVCKRETDSKEVATACSKYLFNNGGKDLVFLFDGYDEFPEHLQKDSLVADILKRKVLPLCGLVVSSRPHASVRLRKQATIKVDVLGFAEEERKLYIENSMKGQLQKVKELTNYLEDNLTINGLCFIPFNMVILTYLFNQGIPLPSNSVELYHRFVCLTICRHLAKCGDPLENEITNIADLPEPCNKIVKQLAKLSLEGLNDNKLIFTLEEMKAACPDITAIPGAINGFGLLQAVQHFGITAKTMTFNFSHFSIQEFLAAHHVTQLPAREELVVLREKFWSDIHANMFSIYTTLTKGQRPAFKQFIRQEQPSFLQTFQRFFPGGRDKAAIAVSNKFLEDKVKCLRLFRCFKEAGDGEICRSIKNAKCFDDKVINLGYTSLSPYDIECVTLFLTCSPHKEWEKLYLSFCNIQDIGLRILHRDLTSHDVTIRELNLSSNGLTKSSSSSIKDITIHCRVEVLNISSNDTIGEDPALYDMLSLCSCRLVRLYMYDTSLSSPSAIVLFNALAKRNKLLHLDIDINLITDEACDVIATTMANTSLVKLWMWGNKISAEATQQLVQAIQKNNTLQELGLPLYIENVMKRIRTLEEEVNKNRKSRGCQTKLNITFLW